jgi:hypothetical protein
LGLNEAVEKDKGICKRGKIYKIGENGALVERFKDITLTWKEDGSDTLYNKLFHAFIGQFDMCLQYFYELSREYMDFPNV